LTSIEIPPTNINTTTSLPNHPTTAKMAPIALGPKHQDLLKAYIEVSKTSGADWTAIATKADYPTSKYARDQWALVKSKLLATDNGTTINLADRQIALLKATIEVMKTEVGSPTRKFCAPNNLFLTDAVPDRLGEGRQRRQRQDLEVRERPVRYHQKQALWWQQSQSRHCFAQQDSDQTQSHQGGGYSSQAQAARRYVFSRSYFSQWANNSKP
jgi:hypothetical protein